MTSPHPRLAAFLLLAVPLAACSSPTPIPAPATASATRTPFISPTRKPTRTATATITPPGGRFLSLTELAPGEYVAYSSDGLNLWIAQPGGAPLGALSPLTNWVTSISPNLRYLAELPNIRDLRTGELTYYQELESCWELPSWAPDSQRLVVSCFVDWISNLFVFSLADGSLQQITAFTRDSDLGAHFPSWSPDGKWIAYDQSIGRSGDFSSEVGLHILDAGCISNAPACQSVGEGLGEKSPYSWSPDSAYIAAAAGNDLDILHIQNGRASLDQRISIGSQSGWPSWSPAGDRIAVEGDGCYLLDIYSNTLQLIDQCVMFWLSIP